MKGDINTPRADIEFIRLFFRSRHEEALAIRIARLLASVVGDRITQLRPETKLSEIIRWSDSLDAVGVVMRLEEVFGHAIPDDMADDFEHLTFRELVEYASESNHAA